MASQRSRRSRAIAALERAPDEAVAAVVELLEAYGPEPTAAALAEASAWNAATSAERRRTLIEQSITREEAAGILGVSAQSVSAMLKRGDLAGLKDGRQWRLPRWQFDPESESGALPGLRGVLAAFPASIGALSRWIQIENPDLGGISPQAALRRGRVADVLGLINMLSASRRDRSGRLPPVDACVTIGHMLGRNPLIADRIGPYYVYLLIDPRDGKPFYVGKGTRDRFLSHGELARRPPLEESLIEFDADATKKEREDRISRIREIRAQGQEPQVAFARTKIETELEAYLVEAALIDTLDRYSGHLVNGVRGHHTPEGFVTLHDLEVELTTDVVTTKTPAILIVLFDWVDHFDPETGRAGHGFRSSMTPDDLLQSVRAWWPFSLEKAQRYQYAVAVHDGITRGVWEIVPGSWQSSPRPESRPKWCFSGREATPEIREQFVGRVGRRFPTLRPDGKHVFGRGSSFAYWP